MVIGWDNLKTNAYTAGGLYLAHNSRASMNGTTIYTLLLGLICFDPIIALLLALVGTNTDWGIPR